jgi:hypothetical protein
VKHRLPYIVTSALAALACATTTGCFHRAVAPAPKPTPSKPAVHLVPSPLNGVPVLPASTRHRISAVMVDNYPHNTRPQSGLRDADVIYEVEAEGGITRYMALFLEQTPKKIGPVRSTRLYFVDLSRPFNPMLAHAGENDDVWEPLKELRADGFADMEEILQAEEAFWRDDTREMPHNLYTSIARLRSAAPNHGWPDTPFRKSLFNFKGAAQRVPQPDTAPGVSLDFWLHYHVRYVYHDGAYQRYIGGVEQHDLDDPAPYRVADIVAVWVPATVIDEVGDLRMDVFGDFPAMVIRQGRVVDATWDYPDPTALPRLLDAAGSEVVMTPGQIYIEVLPQGGSVTIGNQSWSH